MKKKLLLISCLGIFLATAIGSNFSWPVPDDDPEVAVKKNDYTQAWKKVDSLERKGLPQSALKVVDKIYEQAKAEQNAPQLVKSVIHRLKFKDQREEKAFVQSLEEIKEETKNASPPLRNIFHSISAEMYWWYYQRHRWQIVQRSTIEGNTSDDIETWDLKRLAREMAHHYELSLKAEETLKKTPVEQFEAIIINGKNSHGLRPSLYDFLAHRAIDFYTHGEAGLTEPADQFNLNRPEYLGTYDNFIKLNIPPAEDPFSFQQKALILLQQLIAFHAANNNPAALIDADLKRIRFINQFASFPDRSILHEKALLALEKNFITDPASTLASYVIASIHQTRAGQYDPLVSDEHKWERKKGHDICQKTIERFPDSRGATLCRNLLSTIEEKSLTFELERVNASGKHFRALVTYTNLQSVQLRIVKIDQDLPLYTLRMNSDQLLDYLLKQEKIKEWQQSLEDDGDFQSHKTEVKIPALEPGQYAILITTDSSFGNNNSLLNASDFWVSDLSYVSRNNIGNTTDLYVFDRNTGSPLKDAKVTVYEETYDYASRQNTLNMIKELFTDQNGKATLSVNGTHHQFQFVFSYKDDRLSTLRPVYLSNRSRPIDREVINTHFFTDRAIYRPGQTVYFKGIMISSRGKERQIVAGRKTTVTFHDVNNQKISEVQVQTNDYGTYHGSFTAPSGGLNGMMRIADEFGNQTIRVEEYKRPRFEVKFEPVKGSYKLNEDVTVKGKATSYSGAVVDGAKVNYRVVRTARYAFHPWMYRSYLPPLPEAEIQNGTLTAKDDGTFEITFKALSQNSINQNFDPVYNFRVIADVTDITGETQSAETYVAVSKTALILSTDIPDKLDKQQKNIFKVVTTNLNGEFEPSQVNLIVWKLHHPANYYRSRLWQQADRYSMTEQDYKKSFPHDEFRNENNPDTWKKEQKVFEAQINTNDTTKYRLKDLDNWAAGRYVVEMNAKDAFGTLVEWKSYFTVFSSGNNELPSNKTDWFTPLKVKGEPGEKAAFIIGSAARNVKILYEIEHRNKIVKSEWITINQEQKKIEIPIEEQHRGNFAFHLTFVRDGRVYQHTQTIEVPYTNKMLDISFETFRDHLLPGEKETWKITIHDKKGNKAAAEMMSSLYDASLDAFAPHGWHFNIFSSFYATLGLQPGDCFQSTHARNLKRSYRRSIQVPGLTYDQLNWFGYNYGYRSYGYTRTLKSSMADGVAVDMEMAAPAEAEPEPMLAEGKAKLPLLEELLADDNDQAITGISSQVPEKELPVTPRTNFNETAFFYPQLSTNEKGEVVINFTMPEALTRWKLLSLAHTKDLKSGLITKELITQKNLMVVTNPPRFFREGDEMMLSAKVTNLEDQSLSGTAEVRFYDAFTRKDITRELLKNANPQIDFTVESEKSHSFGWSISVPEGYAAITYQVSAKSGQFTDGEERMIPVLTNRMLVTESMPLPVKGDQSKDFSFDKLLRSASSNTLRHERLTLEFTSNPAWYAVQALPYLMEFPYECAEQIFSRYYANSIASHIANSSPKIKAVFESWKNIDKDALLSNLQKNQELKSLLLEETPWVMNALDESERKKRVGLLFDLNKMANELHTALAKLQQMQSPNGGWPWFKGMPESRYITQHIVTGMGHLDHMSINTVRQDQKTFSMLKMAIRYLDMVIREDYEWLKAHNQDLSSNHLSSVQIQYLYARSYFTDIPVQSQNKEAFNYYLGQAKKYWLDNNKYMQGMIALALHRLDDKEVPKEIMASLKENALLNEEMGMYWKNDNGYYWYQAPIEQQALLIEAFDEVANDQDAVEEMKVWLLKQKQTQDWKTTRATTEACYALLQRGTDLLETTHEITIRLGEQVIEPSKDKELKQEAGTGYFKKSWSRSEIKPEMGKIKVSRTSLDPKTKNTGVSWGAVYWQYFEQLDKITPHETPLQLKKQLFVERNTTSGPVIEAITDQTELKVGDKVKVRIELRVDRDMEYVHMKDMRASGFEPINVLSGYRYQDGLGYYESTKDAATNFFFDYLRKGTYVFEYPLRANIAGNFSNGITTIQCMYAPEFASHSEGVRVRIAK